jgi:hypothetical protein
MAFMDEPTLRRMDRYVSGLEVAPKVSTVIPRLELGKSYVFRFRFQQEILFKVSHL